MVWGSHAYMTVKTKKQLTYHVILQEIYNVHHTIRVPYRASLSLAKKSFYLTRQSYERWQEVLLRFIFTNFL